MEDYGLYELRLLLDKHVGGPSQDHDIDENPNKIYLPLAGAECQIGLTYSKEKIIAMEPGPAFDATKWRRSSKEMALSRCRTIDANDLVDDRAHAAAVAARHVSMAEARKARCVLAEMRWR